MGEKGNHKTDSTEKGRKTENNWMFLHLFNNEYGTITSGLSSVISSFLNMTPDQIMYFAAMKRLQDMGASYFILDLRDNLGGLVQVVFPYIPFYLCYTHDTHHTGWVLVTCNPLYIFVNET